MKKLILISLFFLFCSGGCVQHIYNKWLEDYKYELRKKEREEIRKEKLLYRKIR